MCDRQTILSNSINYFLLIPLGVSITWIFLKKRPCLYIPEWESDHHPSILMILFCADTHHANVPVITKRSLNCCHTNRSFPSHRINSHNIHTNYIQAIHIYVCRSRRQILIDFNQSQIFIVHLIPCIFRFVLIIIAWHWQFYFAKKWAMISCFRRPTSFSWEAEDKAH